MAIFVLHNFMMIYCSHYIQQILTMTSTVTRRYKRLFVSYFGNILWCCTFGICLVIGYLFGMMQNSEKLCVDYPRKVIEEQIKPSKYKTTLLVTVFSAPVNIKRRNIIRNTWFLTKDNNEVTTYFVTGTASLNSVMKKNLNKENELHGDLILLPNISDSYSKLSKKLIELIKEVDKNFSFVFLLKVDDDSFVRLDALFEELSYKTRERLYWGFFDGRAKVKTRGKWVEENWNLCGTYLPYAKGGGYILSSDLVQYLSQNADLLSLYKNEDVSLGAWLAALDIKRTHDPNFDTEYESRGCFNSYLVTHKQSESMMLNKYQNLVNLGNMCESEHRKRFSYIYNWNVSPNFCCIRNDSRIP